MKKKVVAMIPIKLNNQRLPGKNTMQLGNKVLCQYLFDTIKKVNNIDEVYVYCSDEKICEFIPEGIHFLKRSPKLDEDSVKSAEIIQSFISQIEADVYVLTHVTQPFISVETLHTSIDKVINEDYDSAFAAHEIKEFAWYKNNPINYDFQNVVKTQDLEPVFIEGELYIFKKDVFTQLGRRIGEKPYIHPIGWKENVCIDTAEDFEMAQAVIELEKKNS